MDPDLYRIKRALRRGSIDRNAKTALALGIAISGGFFSMPALAATISGTFLGIVFLRNRKRTRDKQIEKLNIIDNDDF